MSDPVGTYKPKVPYSQALDAPFPSRKDKQREDILETFKQVKVNLSLLEAIKQIPAYVTAQPYPIFIYLNHIYLFN